MKCATTTLHQDLSQHPKVFCGRKELNALTTQTGLLGSPIEIYENNFKSAKPDQILGDVSTSYSMIPDLPGIPELAYSLLGPKTKIIYLVRDPIGRTLSHHQHMMNVSNKEKMGPDINHEIDRHPALIHYSCYARQLLPWVDLFTLRQISVVKFEDYTADRKNKVNEIFKFLEVPILAEGMNIDEQGANRSQDRKFAGKFVLKLYHSLIFQQVIKPAAPSFLRKAMQGLLLRQSKIRAIQPTQKTIQLIFEGVQDDVFQLQELLQLPQPLWDIEQLRQSHLQKATR